jgi:hypothetical protein
MKRLAAAFLLIAMPAMAQPESIAVEHQRNLAGLWRISLPAGFSIGFSGPARFGPMRDNYCRITDDWDIHCLSGGYAADGTAALGGDRVHIAWGTRMARMAVDAIYGNGGFAGIFAFKLSGLRHDAPERSVGTRILPPSINDQASRHLVDVMTQLASGKVTAPYDAKAIAAHEGAFPGRIAKLGAIEAVAFLGRTPLQIERPEGDLYSVHIVEFAHGELLCGLHQREDGVQDALRCV